MHGVWELFGGHDRSLNRAAAHEVTDPREVLRGSPPRSPPIEGVLTRRRNIVNIVQPTGRATRRTIVLASLMLARVVLDAHPGWAAANAGNDREPNPQSITSRQDVRLLPGPLKRRVLAIAQRPHTFLPITAFSEADGRSQLIPYYLLDTAGFQPNVFTSIVPGINDGAIPTAANFANGGLPTVGSVRVVLEPKPGLPTDPDDVRAFIDIFTDVSGLFVINNESGWYEGWMIHD